MIEKEVQKIFNKLNIKDHKLLLAVSGGSDSMALLDIVSKFKQNIIVLHVNHNLRSASDNEESFLKNYCQNKKIEFQSSRWENPSKNNIENNARKFRYHFFEKVMKNYKTPYLLTAHHQDDQIETILQKLVNGSTSLNEGIEEIREFANGYLVRPLLNFSKEELLNYVKNNNIPFVEDESNFSLNYQRNRIRHELIPWLVKENPSFKKGLLERNFEQESKNNLILNRGKYLFNKIKTEDFFNISSLTDEDDIYAFTKYMRKYLTEERNVQINFAKERQIYKLIYDKKGNKKVRLNEKFDLERNYQNLYLQKRLIVEKQTKDVYTLNCNESIYLSENEWITLTDFKNIKVPEKFKNMEYIRWEIFEDEVKIRFPKQGDKLLIGDNKHKKLTRLFIDNKIPRESRSKMRVLLNKNNEILGVLPIRMAYLSKSIKTDKMYYITYYYKKGLKESLC